MRYLCSACERLVEPETASLHDGEIRLSCPKCGAEEPLSVTADEAGDGGPSKEGGADHDAGAAPEGARLEDDGEDSGPTGDEEPPSPRAGPPPPTSEAPRESSCPKCGEPKKGGDACPRCGLVFANWSEHEAAATPPAILKIWAELQDRWEDAGLHDQFLRECLTTSALDFAARSYRGRDDETARRQLDKLTTLAFQTLQATEASRVDTRLLRTVGWVIVLLVFLGIVVALGWMVLRGP